MRSPKAGTVGPFPIGFTAPFLLPYFLTAFVFKVMENAALRRHLDLVDILIVFLKLNLETLLFGVILWPLFYLRRSVRIGPVYLIYLIALFFNFVSYAVSLRFSTLSMPSYWVSLANISPFSASIFPPRACSGS